ncbi:MAG: alkaline phosphatase [Marinoscillum sp.]
MLKYRYRKMKIGFKLLILLVISLVVKGCKTADKDSEDLEQEPPNIIFMIGDGMGLTQVSTSFYYKDDPSNFERFKSIGISKTSCTSHKVTDSAAGATAFSTGEKTYKRAIGVSKDTVSLPTILEQLETEGYKTGLVSLTSITHATPASFYAHVKDRDMHEEIAAYLPESGVDFFAGGGLKFFNKRADGKDLYSVLQESYIMDTVGLNKDLSPENKYGFLLAQNEVPNKTQGRGDFLKEATESALDYLDQSAVPFFLMVEGSFIDWGGHAEDADMLVQEVLDFDKTIGAVLDFMETHPNTLLVVTADHETGGTALGKYYEEDPETGKKTEVPDSVAVYFVTDQHTATAVPVFAKGVGEELFSGVYENNEIYHKFRELLDH